MDQDLFPPPGFTLPGFTVLVELTMVAQRINHNQAITFLEQRWAWTGLGGVHPARDDDEGQEGDDATPRCPDREASQLLCLARVGTSADLKASWWGTKWFLRSPTLRATPLRWF